MVCKKRFIIEIRLGRDLDRRPLSVIDSVVVHLFLLLGLMMFSHFRRLLDV